MENEWNAESDFFQFTYTEPLFDQGMGFSFHLYQGHGDGDWKDFANIEHERLKNSMITETNVYGGMVDGTTQLEKANSPYWIVRFAQMLEFAYKHRIARIYFHKLKDQPGIKGKLGFFDVDGNAKPSYNHLLKVKDVIDEGFMVVRNEDHVVITGKKKKLVVAFEKTEINKEWGILVDASQSSKISNNLPADEWAIYEHH